MNQEASRDFKGIWIPREVWLNPNLSIEEKVLFIEIQSLDGVDGCYASNEYFTKFFGWSERVLQLHLAKLKKMKLIRIESFDGRKRILKTTHEIFYTPEVKNSSPLPCKNLHLSLIGDSIERENKDYNKEKKVVCYPPAVAEDSQKSLTKDEIKKNSVDEALRGVKLPSILKKKNPAGEEVTVSLGDIFKASVAKKKDWRTSEIHDAWEALVAYSGAIRDPFAYFEGTIKNFRTKKKSEYMSKKGEKECNMKKEILSEDVKPIALGNVSPEHPSLQSMLEKAHLWS